MALDTTLSGASANSYASIEEADEYFAAGAHLQSATWLALTDEQKEMALRTAARDLNRLRYFGRKAVSNQALEWPRVYHGLWFADSIPSSIKSAQLEQALARSAGACCATVDAMANLSQDAQAYLQGFWTNMGTVYARDRECSYDFSCNPYDGQRELDDPDEDA